MEQMIVTIKDGSVKVEVEGAKGSRCLELTQAIERLIGEVETQMVKKDFYINPKTKQIFTLGELTKADLDE